MACVAIGCKSRMGVITENNQKLSFHRFPKENTLRNKWIRNMKRKNWTPSPYSRLCSLHFSESCYRDGYQSKFNILHSDAVPTIFQHSLDLNKKVLRCSRPSRPELCDQLASKSAKEEIVELKSKVAEQNRIISQLHKIAAHYKRTAARGKTYLKRIKQKYMRQNIKLADYDAIISELQQKLVKMEDDKIQILVVA